MVFFNTPRLVYFMSATEIYNSSYTQVQEVQQVQQSIKYR